MTAPVRKGRLEGIGSKAPGTTVLYIIAFPIVFEKTLFMTLRPITIGFICIFYKRQHALC
jgi:hypothetical protein